MKRLVLSVVVLLVAVTTTFAQEQGKIRVSLDLGYSIPSDGGGGGVAIYLEPKYNLKDNMSVGIRLGSAALVKNFKNTASGDEFKGEIAANNSYMATFDYHFNGSGSSFVPYVGGGLGYVTVANIDVKSRTSSGAVSTLELEAGGKFGGMIRAGFEWAKFRMGVDFNIIPESDLENLNGDTVGSAKNSYIGISLGFFVGGGKWGR